MDSIILKVRKLINDNSTTFSDIFTYGSSSIFTLSESNVIAITEVYRNDVSSGVTHTYNSTSNKVTVSSSLTTGDTIQIDYTCYGNYSDTELTSYVQAALVHIGINGYYNFEYDSTTNDIYPIINSKEENLIAIVTSLLIEPDNKTIRLPDIMIGVTNDVTNVPTDVKIARTIARFKKDNSGIWDILDI